MGDGLIYTEIIYSLIRNDIGLNFADGLNFATCEYSFMCKILFQECRTVLTGRRGRGGRLDNIHG